MKSVDRALGLLRFFTVTQPELGLAEVTRQAKLDKATVHRILTALARNGLLEQSPSSKKYRLGAEVLRLARVREASVPLAATLTPVLAQLSQATGETAHAALGAKEGMLTIGVSEPNRSIRVFLDASATLPFHATASGLAYSAFADAETLKGILRANAYQAFTPTTLKTEAEFLSEIDKIRVRGFAIANRTLELDTIGVASAFFGAGGQVLGTVAVAGLDARMDDAALHTTSGLVLGAANHVTRQLGGSRELP